MQEFSPFSPAEPPHLSSNYFPVITREPTPESYYDRARHNAKRYARNMYEEELRRDMSNLIGLSEFALLALAMFDRGGGGRRARHTLELKHKAQAATNVAGMPYTIPAVVL